MLIKTLVNLNKIILNLFYLSHGGDNGSIIGHGSPRRVLRVNAAPSANDSKQ